MLSELVAWNSGFEATLSWEKIAGYSNFISLYCPLRKIWALKNTGDEKTTRFSKTTEPIRFLDSSNCAQISSE
jgi:hypothetical protein